MSHEIVSSEQGPVCQRCDRPESETDAHDCLPVTPVAIIEAVDAVAYTMTGEVSVVVQPGQYRCVRVERLGWGDILVWLREEGESLREGSLPLVVATFWEATPFGVALQAEGGSYGEALHARRAQVQDYVAVPWRLT